MVLSYTHCTVIHHLKKNIFSQWNRFISNVYAIYYISVTIQTYINIFLILIAGSSLFP